MTLNKNVRILFFAAFLVTLATFSYAQSTTKLDLKDFSLVGDYYVKKEAANLDVGDKIIISSGDKILYEIQLTGVSNTTITTIFRPTYWVRVISSVEGDEYEIDRVLTFLWGWNYFASSSYDLSPDIKVSAKTDFSLTLDIDSLLISVEGIGATSENSPPEAKNIALDPADPKDSDDIKCCFEYFDADSDPPAMQNIVWRKEGKNYKTHSATRIEQYNFCATLSNTETQQFESWSCVIYPKANTGKTDGQAKLIGPVVIGVAGNKPTVSTTTEPSTITTTPSGDPTIVSTLSGLAGTIDNKVGQYYRCLVAKTEAEAGVDCSELSGRVGECSNMLESMKSLEAKYPEINGYIDYIEEVDTAVFGFPRETYLKTPANTPTYATMKPNLTRAMISVESSWQADKPAANDEGSYGIMQVSKSNLLGTGYPAAQKGQADIFTADKWKDPYDNIMRGITINNIHYYNYILPNTEGKCDNPVLKNTGIAGATFKEALGVAAYTAGHGVKCDYLAPAGSYDSVLRTTALKLAYYRIFAENYEKYKKGETICALQGLEVPPVEEIPPKLEPPTTGCGILCMLSYIDKAFVDQIFKSNK